MADNTIEIDFWQIESLFKPGLSRWMKKTHPQEWDSLLDLEREINRYAMSRDEAGTRENLDKYKSLLVEMGRQFENCKSRRSKQQELFNNVD
jgi:hypothetical protein